MAKLRVQIKAGNSMGEVQIDKSVALIVLDLDQMAKDRGYKLVPIPPEPEDHIILGEN